MMCAFCVVHDIRLASSLDLYTLEGRLALLQYIGDQLSRYGARCVVVEEDSVSFHRPPQKWLKVKKYSRIYSIDSGRILIRTSQAHGAGLAFIRCEFTQGWLISLAQWIGITLFASCLTLFASADVRGYGILLIMSGVFGGYRVVELWGHRRYLYRAVKKWVRDSEYRTTKAARTDP